MSPTPSEKPKRWTRAKAPRVRTGCKTCKIRHLKCDEGKPHCRRCEKDGHVCDGYEAVPCRKNKNKRSDLSPQEWHDLTIRRKDGAPSSVSVPPGLVPDISRLPTEIDLFHHFRTCTIQDLGTALTPTEFWYVHALPLGHAVEPIKYAICALGGAHKRFKSQELALAGGGSPVFQALEEISIQQYNQAIHHIKSFTRTPSNSNMEVILTCCVIFICVETLLGRYAEALRHLQSGCALLTSLRQLSAESPMSDGSPREDAKERNKFFDDIAAMLIRLGQDVAIYLGADVIPQLYFYSTPQVQVQHPITPFESVSAAATSLFQIETEWSARAYITERWTTPPRSSETRSPDSDPEMLNDKAYLDSVAPLYYNWSDRFNLFKSQCNLKALPKQDQYRVMTLSTEQAIWATLLDLRSFEDDLPPEAADEILRRAELQVALGAFESTPVFAFDANLMPAMMLLCTSCSDTGIQRRCVNLLRSIRRREGLWDSQEIADLLESLVMAREQNLIPWDIIPWKVPQLAALISSFRFSQFKAPKGILSLAEEGVECFWHGVKGVTY